MIKPHSVLTITPDSGIIVYRVRRGNDYSWIAVLMSKGEVVEVNHDENMFAAIGRVVFSQYK